jgi:hypothetical protein
MVTLGGEITMRQAEPHKKIFANRTTFEEKCERLLKSPCVHEITTLLGAVGMEKGREKEQRELYQQVLERNLANPPVVSQCLFHLRVLGDNEVRRGVDTVLSRGYRGDCEATYLMGLQALMAVKEVLPIDLEKIARGLYADTASVRSNVERDINRLDVERLSRMMEVNETNAMLHKPFAAAFGMSVMKAKAAAEMILASYEARLPAL